MPDKKLTDSVIVKAREVSLEEQIEHYNERLKETLDSYYRRKKDKGAEDTLEICVLQESAVLISKFESIINHLREENKRLSTLAELGTKRANDYRVMRDRALKAEKEVERLKTNEERYNRIYHLLLDPLIVANGKNGELRPIKRTSRQDVYHTLLRAQEIMEIPYRWFPWKKDGGNK